jgi:hypothetical protein
LDGSEICKVCRGGVVLYNFTRNITSGNVSYLYSEWKQYTVQIGMLDYPCGRMIYAVNAGLYAAASSLLGKLSGIQDYSTCVSTIVSQRQ